MGDVRAEFQDDQPDEDDEEYHQVEPKSRRAANFIDEDEFEGEEVDLTQGQPYAATAFSGQKLPPLPAGLQRIKDVFDMLSTQKQMVGWRHLEKSQQGQEGNPQGRATTRWHDE